MSGRYITNSDRKRWPGSEIQMYYGCPCLNPSPLTHWQPLLYRAFDFIRILRLTVFGLLTFGLLKDSTKCWEVLQIKKKILYTFDFRTKWNAQNYPFPPLPFIKACITSGSPFTAAWWSAVIPNLFVRFGSAPFSNRDDTTSWCPYLNIYEIF